MNTRYLLIAATAVALGAQASAEPAKPAASPAAQPAERPVMMASADNVRPAPVAVGEAQAATPAKRPRAARVTTCRCAGQNER